MRSHLLLFLILSCIFASRLRDNCGNGGCVLMEAGDINAKLDRIESKLTPDEIPALKTKIGELEQRIAGLEDSGYKTEEELANVKLVIENTTAALDKVSAENVMQEQELTEAKEIAKKYAETAIESATAQFSELKEATAKLGQAIVEAQQIAEKYATDTQMKLDEAATKSHEEITALKEEGVHKSQEFEEKMAGLSAKLDSSAAEGMKAIQDVYAKVAETSADFEEKNRQTLNALTEHENKIEAELREIKDVSAQTAQQLKDFMDLSTKQYGELAARTGKKIYVGTITNDKFVDYPGLNGLYADIDFTNLGLTKPPEVWATLHGQSGNWRTTGVTSIYSLSRTGCRIYIYYLEEPRAVDTAKNAAWEIHYAVLPND